METNGAGSVALSRAVTLGLSDLTADSHKKPVFPLTQLGNLFHLCPSVALR